MNAVRDWLRRLLRQETRNSAAGGGLVGVVGVEDLGNRESKANEAGDLPGAKEAGKTQQRREEEDPADSVVTERVERDGDERPQQVALGEDDLRDILQGGHSAVVTVLALVVLAGLDLTSAANGDVPRFWQAAAGYACVSVVSFLVLRRLLRKQEAVLPPDRLGAGRFVLLAAGVAVFVSGEEAGRGLAPWLVMAVVAVGGLADGCWLAIVSARRRMGFWRAWRELFRHERETRRYCWRSLFGERRAEGRS